MEQFVGVSSSGNLQEAIRGLSSPQLIMLFAAKKDQFQTAVAQLEEAFPGVPSIGCVGQSYGGTTVLENGILVVALKGKITAVTNVIKNVSKAPVRYVRELQKDISAIRPGNQNTVMIDFCSGNDECVLTTIQSVIDNKDIQLTGGTASDGTVACNGVVYQDACAYALVRNDGGKVKVYRENIYTPMNEQPYVVTKAVPTEYRLCELNGKNAIDVYTEALNIRTDEVEKQTFKNPFGRIIGDEVFIVSLKERLANGQMSCYRKVNPKDRLYILKAEDDQEVLENTVRTIKSEFTHISAIFSINCIFRYMYFKDLGHMNHYLQRMESLGTHAGLIGMGEHYNKQHTNQTMSCVVFE